MSRAVIANGSCAGDAYRMADDALRSITGSWNLTDLSYTLLDILDVFIEMAFSKEQSSQSSAIQKAIRYIQENYNEPLSLENVAGFVG